MENTLIDLSYVVYYYKDTQNATFDINKMTTYDMINGYELQRRIRD